jgi:hypothetical protein
MQNLSWKLIIVTMAIIASADQHLDFDYWDRFHLPANSDTLFYHFCPQIDLGEWETASVTLIIRFKEMISRIPYTFAGFQNTIDEIYDRSTRPERLAICKGLTFLPWFLEGADLIDNNECNLFVPLKDCASFFHYIFIPTDGSLFTWSPRTRLNQKPEAFFRVATCEELEKEDRESYNEELYAKSRAYRHSVKRFMAAKREGKLTDADKHSCYILLYNFIVGKQHELQKEFGLYHARDNVTILQKNHKRPKLNTLLC